MEKVAFFDEPDITAEYACLQNEFFLGEIAWLQIRSQYLCRTLANRGRISHFA